MNTLTVLVKGNKHAVALAAAQRGIPFVFDHETRTRWIHETTGRVPMTHADKVAYWFTEPATTVDGYGYPDGTCLFYTETRANG